MKHLIKIGTQFIGFRDNTEDLRGNVYYILRAPFFPRQSYFVSELISLDPPQRALIEPKNMLKISPLSLSEARRLARRLNEKPLLLKTFGKDFTKLKKL